MPPKLIENVDREFEKYMVEEYGKWKIGRTEAKEFLHSQMTLAYKAGIERAVDVVDRNLKIIGWTHTRGSHADDFQDIEPCDCRADEIKYGTEALESLKKAILQELTNLKDQNEKGK
jgi:hypothetical protein